MYKVNGNAYVNAMYLQVKSFPVFKEYCKCYLLNSNLNVYKVNIKMVCIKRVMVYMFLCYRKFIRLILLICAVKRLVENNRKL